MRRFLMMFLMTGVGFAQTTQIYTGTIKDLTQQVVTSGQVTFTLSLPNASTIPGTGTFVPTTTLCNINVDGTLSGYIGGVVSGACIVTANISLTPTGTSYKICEQPNFSTPGSCFYDYALGGTKDISSVIPTLTTSPLNYGGVPGPPGCVVGTTCTGNLTPLSVNTVYYASRYQAADVGAQINLADFAAGSGAADIIVTSPGTVTTVPTIRSNHRLILAAPLTWNVAPILSNNSQIIGTGSNAVQTVSVMAQWITATSLTNLEIDNLWVNNTSIPTAEGSAILACISCTGVIMNFNHAFGIGVLFTRSTATTYAAVNSSNLTKGVHLEGNFVDANEFSSVQSSRVITLAWLQFAQNVTSVGNDIINGEYNLEWWGGDAAVEGLTLSNPRWAQNINVVGGRATNVVTGWWGSMGQDVSVTGVTVDGCIDVCLDGESSTRVVFSGFTVRNALNGGLAVFFSSVDNSFGPGIVSSDTAGTVSAMLFAHNVSANQLSATGVKIHNVKFICRDPSTLCKLSADPIAGFQFNDNELINSYLTFTGTNSSNYEISRNRFGYTFVPSATFNAVGVPGQVISFGLSSTIAGNIFQSSVTQPAGTFAINASITDANASDILLVSGNITYGFTNDAKFIANSSNAGISPTFIFQGNVWGSNSITKTTLGVLGRFIGNTYNAATDSTVFTGPVGIGGLINGTGLQMISVAGCTPASVVLAACTSTLTLPVAEIDPAYIVVCNARGANVFVGSTKNETTTTFQVDIYATATSAVVVNNISCLVSHP